MKLFLLSIISTRLGIYNNLITGNNLPVVHCNTKWHAYLRKCISQTYQTLDLSLHIIVKECKVHWIPLSVLQGNRWERFVLSSVTSYCWWAQISRIESRLQLPYRTLKLHSDTVPNPHWIRFRRQALIARCFSCFRFME